MANILVIYGGEDILRIIKIGLEKDGHSVTILANPTHIAIQKKFMM